MRQKHSFSGSVLFL